MRLLLTGSTGMLGRALVRAISARNDIELATTAFTRAAPPAIRADLTDPEQARALFDAARPDVVVHAAAERRPDVVDERPEAARAINVDATSILARECARRGAFMLYISTDYVFDGANPPYYPDSPVNPLNEYGALKLEGERCTERELGNPRNESPAPRAAILRIPLLYGPVEKLEECSVTELALLLKKMAPCRVEHWAKRYPIHVDDVADAILRIVDARASGKIGTTAGAGLPLYLLSGPKAFTKYEMLAVMAHSLDRDSDFATPNPEPPKGAPRPKDCRMDAGRLQALGYMPRKSFETEIRGVLEPFFRG